MAYAGSGPWRWKNYWNYTFYTSATNLSSTGNTGVIATPIGGDGQAAIYPLIWLAVGNNMTTDETNIITIDWYTESAGTLAVGTTTFDQLTAGNLTDLEAWPGDVTAGALAYNAGRDLAPMPPYHKITWTLAGTTKSMGFTLFLSYQTME